MIDIGEIETALGAKCHVEPLKRKRTLRARILRKLQFDGASVSPTPVRVDTADGRVFKLLVAEETTKVSLNALLIRYQMIAPLDCSPHLIWQNDQALLFDFVPGEIPDMKSPETAAAFGRSLAKIHQLDVDNLPATTIMRSAGKYLQDLAGAGFVSADQSDRIRTQLEAQLPAQLRTSVDYADVQPGNFRLDGEGRLKFIDIGGFQLGRVTGEGFFGHPGSQKLDQDAFAQAYRAAGGGDEIFEFRKLIVALSDLRRGARLALWAGGMKILQPRRARSFRSRAATLVERLDRFSHALPDPIK